MAADSPLVHRTVRTGGVLLAVAAVQFAAVLLWVESRASGFDPKTTSVLSLGGPSGLWAMAFDASLIVLGVLGTIGLLFGWTAFDERRSRGLGILVLLVASLSATVGGVLLVARNRVPAGSVSVALDVAVVAAGIGLLIVSSAMHLHGRWRISSAYTFATGLVILAAAVLYATHITFSLGSGGFERLIAGAVLLWGLVEGLHLAILHRFAPGLPLKVATA